MYGDKVIRDSVHGNIVVPKNYVKCILDTPFFQRLRRIEQTSVRAIYPSARHDRFIHSLGVYYVGQRIVKHLKPQLRDFNEFTDTQIGEVTESYLIACLLHDIAHSPFSHTFEEYYGRKEDLYQRLMRVSHLNLQWEPLQIDEVKQHEYASAILVAEKFADSIDNELQGKTDLVCRMIIGAPYRDRNHYHQICNCFISLLHGEVDADRLDYACRDVWASGYKSVNVDVSRVVHSMHLKRYNNEYRVCFDYNEIGDIRNIMELKCFQITHVFNHHTIVYDQELLMNSAEKMAIEIFPALPPHDALSAIINVDAICGNKEIVFRGISINLQHLCDDDLFFLLKQSNNADFQEYASRQYKRFALWKSPEDFYHMFPDIDKSIDITENTFKQEILEPLAEIMDVSKIWTHEVTYKSRAELEDLPIIIRKEVKKYTEIRHDIFKIEHNPTKFKFTYLYLPKPDEPDDIDDFRNEIIRRIRPVLYRVFAQAAI